MLTVGGNAIFNGTFSAASGEVNGNLAVTGGGTVSNLTVKGTLELPGDLAKGAIPVGGIVVWTQEKVPDGWAVCDGTDGTPDLRARFVMGATDDYPAGTTGGEESVTLTLEQMPDHQHGYPDPGNSDTVRYEETASRYAVWTDYQTGTHYMDPVGEGNPHENRPPFYAVYYIIRVK